MEESPLMESEEKVTYVRLVFESSTLFAQPSDAAHYDEENSIQKYADLCQKRLRQALPGAVVEVLDASSRVGSLQTSINGDPEASDVEYIKQLCAQIYDSLAWQVPKRRLNLAEACEQFRIPIPALRWVCKEGLLEGAEHTDGHWKIPAETFIEKLDSILSVHPEMPTFAKPEVYLYTCNLEDTGSIKILDIPTAIKILVVAPSGFGVSLFTRDNSNVLVTIGDNQIRLVFEHFADKLPWTVGKWAYDAYIHELIVQAQHQGIHGECERREYAGKSFIESIRLEFSYDYPSPDTVWDLLKQAVNVLTILIQDTEVAMRGGPTWKPEYEQKGNEALFCKEVLEHLLNRMGFDPVRYTHGVDEYGRDFIFASATGFGWLQYYGLQAKAGNMSGEANSELNKILGQIDDAFSMPYLGTTPEEIYITAFIVAISGHFTRGAKQKIRYKMSQNKVGKVGSVHFLDQTDIRSLIRKYWLQF